MVPAHAVYNSIFCLLFDSQLKKHCFCTLVCSSDMEAFLEFSKRNESDISEVRERLEWLVDSLAFWYVLNFSCIYLQKGKKLVCISSCVNFLKSTQSGGENVHAFF